METANLKQLPTDELISLKSTVDKILEERMKKLADSLGIKPPKKRRKTTPAS